MYRASRKYVCNTKLRDYKVLTMSAYCSCCKDECARESDNKLLYDAFSSGWKEYMSYVRTRAWMNAKFRYPVCEFHPLNCCKGTCFLVYRFLLNEYVLLIKYSKFTFSLGIPLFAAHCLLLISLSTHQCVFSIFCQDQNCSQYGTNRDDEYKAKFGVSGNPGNPCKHRNSA